MVEANDFYGKFEFRPLEPGFGITIGNALRRILLSSLEGFAISCLKIDGVDHEFATIPGVIDDVTNIILNLKQVRLKRNDSSEATEEKFVINVSGREELRAGDFDMVMQNFTVLNPELVICRMDPSASFRMELTIIKGRGYLPADENPYVTPEIGVIPIDAIFTPIRNVKYEPQPYRVEQKTDYENLVIEITTDGSIHPKEALKEAASILIKHFMLFSDKFDIKLGDGPEDEGLDEDYLRMRQLLKTELGKLDLSVRALNCLKTADIETLGDLCKINRAELLKFRNFGKKSLTELDAKLESLNLTFGMDLSKYKLDKEN